MRFITLYSLKFRALSLPTFIMFGLINRRSGSPVSFAAFITKLRNVATRIIIILQNGPMQECLRRVRVTNLHFDCYRSAITIGADRY